MSANHNNLPKESYKQKSKLHISTINYYNPDVVAAQETGLNFFALEVHNSIEERICFLHEARATYTHNQWEGNFYKHQPGGTMTISTNKATHRTTTSSSDPLGLGRWATILFSGKEGRRTRIVSVYNPITSSPGPHTVNRQQTRRLRATKHYRKPTDALREDLKKAVITWIKAGEHLITGLDANEDVRRGELTSMLRSCGLHNMIHTKHPKLKSVPTFERSDKDTPIDAIMTAFPESNAIQCGYLAFGEGLPGDHRTRWAGIPYSIIFGNKQPHINRTYVEQFAIQDPCIPKKYNDKVVDQYTKQGIIKLAYKTKDTKELGKPIHVVKPLLEELIRKVKKIRLDTAYKIRKKRVGAIPWTPTLQLVCNKQKLRVCVIKRRQGKKTSRNKLRRLQKATRIWNLETISLQEALDKLADVKAEHSEYTKDAATLRKEYLEALAEAIAKENNTTMLTELNNLKLREKQRNTA